MNDKAYKTLSKKMSTQWVTACKDTNYQHKYNGYTRYYTSTFKFCTRVQNLTIIRLSREEPDILQLGFQYNIHNLHALTSGTLPSIWKMPSASLMSNKPLPSDI